ncbi:sensor c-di-GMP phosphodiesterase, contains CSS-motif sensor and EAL domain [Pseudoxanthomonas sp. GM95]|uniref:EAL domain-containing protein n=1 Tax=Pseudoxanthomonas sp. GM95 TaxID=1881043 RepID=UPI0008AE4CC9|nr:EAL domain-containing protein [Pseudoxanthomonas sp. GM95]SEK77771.1 sensor c-di-GMP phosphodiesterase, contains CSS-motif sensor and EAL domain [Pseudoxanthomonas sp. GM95]
MPNTPRLTADGHRRRRQSQRLLACLLVALASCIGLILGGLIGWSIVLGVAKQQLSADTARLLGASEVLEQESKEVLTTFDASPATFCTDDELDRMRELVFRTRYIKDIGRLRDGRLQCSAALWRIAQPPPVPAPDMVTSDGVGVIASTPLLLAKSVQAPLVSTAQTNVVLDREAFPSDAAGGMRYMVAASDGRRLLRIYGDPLQADATRVLAGQPFHQDGSLIVPRCSASTRVCVATSETLSALWKVQWPLLALCAALGAIAGCSLSLAILLARSQRQTFVARLRTAIETGALHVDYQPIVDLADGRTVGAEALVRWRDRDGSLVSPVRFIPVAEQRGWVTQITALVLRQIVEDFGDLLAGEGDFSINLNISAKDLDDSRFLAEMDALLRQHGIAPLRIGIELTEHSTAAREVAIAGTQRFSLAGHRVYVDDFGTGYSSLAYLNELPVYAIKVDRSFTARVDTESVTSSVVPQILDMARALHLSVVVEGVETQAQADWFRAAGAERAQGWLFGRPSTPEALRQRLAEEQGRRAS